MTTMKLVKPMVMSILLVEDTSGFDHDHHDDDGGDHAFLPF